MSVLCTKCDQPIQRVNFALGAKWMHQHPHAAFDDGMYEYCKLSKATPPEEPTGIEPDDHCALSKHVNGPKHGWRFDGDNPLIICAWCDEMRDALSGEVIRAGRKEGGR